MPDQYPAAAQAMARIPPRNALGMRKRLGGYARSGNPPRKGLLCF